LLTLFGLFILAQNRLPVISAPIPVSPVGGTVRNGVAEFKTENWICQLRPLTPEKFLARLAELGINSSMLAGEKVRIALYQFATFEIAFKNLGEENLRFDSDQVVMLNQHTIAGQQARAWDFYSSDGRLERKELGELSHLFATSTIEVPPGKIQTRLVVFKPLQAKFYKKVSIVINHLYYGIETTRLECRFEIRYPKK